MAEAVFGLIGVLIGAFATGASQYLLERRREARSTRTAARLLWIELSEAHGFLARSLEEEEWVGMPHERLGTPAWGRHRGLLAGAADRATWTSVSLAFSTLGELQIAARAQSARSRIDPDSPAQRDILEALEQLRPALLDLESFGEFENSPRPLRIRVARWRAQRRLRRLGLPVD